MSYEAKLYCFLKCTNNSTGIPTNICRYKNIFGSKARRGVHISVNNKQILLIIIYIRFNTGQTLMKLLDICNEVGFRDMC